MMDQDLIRQLLDQWLIEFVEVNNAKLNNWAPCPYARAARLAGLIEVQFTEIEDIGTSVRQALPTLETKDVVVLCFEHRMIDPVILQEWIKDLNRDLVSKNYVILEDHPYSPEFVNGVQMNFGHCGLLIVQKLDKLNTAADRLRDKGYYDHWDTRAVNDVVTWRYPNEILQN